MSAIKGKKSADLIIENAPALLQKQKRLNYSIYWRNIGYEGPTASAYHSATTYDCYKLIYFEAFDAITNAIKNRFEQPAVNILMSLEKLLLKAIKKIDISEEMKL